VSALFRGLPSEQRDAQLLAAYSIHPDDTCDEVIEKLYGYCCDTDWDSMAGNLSAIKVELAEVADVNEGDVDAYFYGDDINRLEQSGLRTTVKKLLKPFRLRSCWFLPLADYGDRGSADGQIVGLGNCSFKRDATVEYDGLRFRSLEEVALYKELRTRDLLFFPNCAAVFGGTPERREPDFLVCHQGKWGILEVNGGLTHTKLTATQEHERARLFKRHGILCVEFYDGNLCRTNPGKAVDDFLAILARHG
jgi:hypothetical protein